MYACRTPVVARMHCPGFARLLQFKYQQYISSDRNCLPRQHPLLFSYTSYILSPYPFNNSSYPSKHTYCSNYDNFSMATTGFNSSAPSESTIAAHGSNTNAFSWSPSPETVFKIIEWIAHILIHVLMHVLVFLVDDFLKRRYAIAPKSLASSLCLLSPTRNIYFNAMLFANGICTGGLEVSNDTLRSLVRMVV